MSNGQHAEPGTAIVPAETIDRPRSMTQVDDWDTAQRAIRTSLRCETDAERVAYIKAMTTSDVEARNSVGKVLRVRDWLLHAVQRVHRDTGEVRDGLRLVLILEDGTTVSSGSDSLIDNWAHVVRMFGGRAAWPMLDVTLSAVRSRNNEGSYLQLASISPVAQAVKQAKSSK